MSIAKISVEKFNNTEQILYDFDKTIGLAENIRQICKQLGLPTQSKVYGLKFLPTKKSAKDHYISENNLDEIQHSDCLKIVFSMDYILPRIIDNIQKEEAEMRKIAFDDISRLSLDPVFIDELHESETDKILINVFINSHLTSDEQLGLIRTVLHLFSRNCILDTSQDVLQKCLCILKNTDLSNEEVRFTLALLQKIIIHDSFQEWKERIMRDVSIAELCQYLKRTTCRELQYSSILLINTIIKYASPDKKRQVILEINSKKNRENIYHHIIMEGSLDRKMEHELYVLQTYLLSLYHDVLTSKINLDNNAFFNREEFELDPEDMRRFTILMEFDDSSIHQPSLANLCFNRESIVSDGSSKRSSAVHSDSISQLTLDALRHYRDLHPKNFYQSQVEEQLYEPGIFITSERVVKMLTKMLHMTVDNPDSKSTFYQPIVFLCSTKTPFFLELFARTMWLLSRTRREMKVSTYADYEKVMYVLKKQIKAALNNKPKNLKRLTEELSNTSFQSVMDQIQQNQEVEMKLLMDTHPCMQALQSKFTLQNKKYVLQRRLNVLTGGTKCSRYLEKKTFTNITLKLTDNYQEIHFLKNKILISDITYIVIGPNCSHSNQCNSLLAFSIILPDNKYDFIAPDERTRCYWTDALQLLMKQPKKLSRFYEQELQELVEMDMRLQLVELQNVVVPKVAPLVPKEPEELPQGLKKRPLSRV